MSLHNQLRLQHTEITIDSKLFVSSKKTDVSTVALQRNLFVRKCIYDICIN